MRDVSLGTSEGCKCQQEYIPQKGGMCFALEQERWLLRLTLSFQADFSQALIQEFTCGNIFVKLWVIVVNARGQARQIDL